MAQEPQNAFIPPDTFKQIVQWAPRVSVEIVLEHDSGILLAKRNNEPAKDEWFWPGTRLYKNETFEACAHRVSKEELGISIDLCCRIGTYAHFWNTSKFDDVDGTHTVNVVYHAYPAEDVNNIVLDDQHSDYKFVTDTEERLHPYVEQYLKDSHILDV